MKNRDTVIREISKDTGFSQKDIRVVIERFEKNIMDNMKLGETINLCGFGKFIPKKKPAGKMMIPGAGEYRELPERIMVKFDVSDLFRKYVNE